MSTKSVVLAPFNSTRSHIHCQNAEQEDNDSMERLPALDIDERLIYDRRVIRYAPRVKDINRQYELNNNQEVDNGVYNKFVKQSQSDDGDGLSQENSLMKSMN